MPVCSVLCTFHSPSTLYTLPPLSPSLSLEFFHLAGPGNASRQITSFAPGTFSRDSYPRTRSGGYTYSPSSLRPCNQLCPHQKQKIRQDEKRQGERESIASAGAIDRFIARGPHTNPGWLGITSKTVQTTYIHTIPTYLHTYIPRPSSLSRNSRLGRFHRTHTASTVGYRTHVGRRF